MVGDVYLRQLSSLAQNCVLVFINTYLKSRGVKKHGAITDVLPSFPASVQIQSQCSLMDPPCSTPSALPPPLCWWVHPTEVACISWDVLLLATI